MNRRELVGALLLAPAAAHAEINEPRRMSQRGELNLTAFARLVAYVRFFHPSDEAAATDWNKFVVSNVETMEAARTPVELVDRLKRAFQPIAPTMRLYASAAPPAAELEAIEAKGTPVELASPLDEASRPIAPTMKVDTSETPGVAMPDLPSVLGTLVMWRHRGVSLTAPSIYRSARVQVTDGRPRTLPLKLGGGVSALLPTTAYGQLTTRTAPTSAAAAADARTYSADERRVRQACIIIAWGVLQHFYPYFDVTDVDWNEELSKGLRRAAEDRDGLAFQHSLSRLVAALRDGHGNTYFLPLAKALPIGWSWIEGRLVITALPADAPGLAIGSVVTRIDGVDVDLRLAALDPEISAATPQWLRFKSLQLLQLRQDGAPVILEGEGPDGRPFKATLSPVDGAGAYAVNARTARANFSEPRPGIVYVDLSRVTEQDLQAHMDELAAAEGIVIDDRGYPSGPARKLLNHLSDRTLHSAQFEMPIITAQDRQGVVFDSRGSWVLPPQTPRFPGRLVLLTGGGSISYAESWAGTFEGERLGPIVGGPTAGTNGDINRLWLPGGYQVLFTGLRVRKQDGSRHHGVGVIPTVPVEQTIAGVRHGRDEVFERGVALAAGET
jgi:hypothetical protein